ncbi:PrnX protein [Decorospora gaudefroyi]|uniref:PrnX protein n=1 Tax=Decorospora gaudefroyi TaxID=184978 RepID=A0A6A5K015_9PLEO|nr:PrnX protein [Decorospora gaudefroyi]
MPFTVLSDANIQTLLNNLTPTDVTSLTQSLNSALIQYSCANETQYQPARAHVTRPTGQTSLFMPATTPTSIGVKIVGVAPSSTPARGQKPEPALRSVLTVCDARGAAVGVLNAAELTAFRTALGSMLLYRFRKTSDNILVFGAGKQAEWHIRLAVLLKGDAIRKITIVNRSAARATALLESLSQSGVVGSTAIKMDVFDVEKKGEADLAALVTEADVVFCTTPSTTPLFSAAVLATEAARKKARYVAAIGSYRLDMAEMDPEMLKQITDPEGPFSNQVYDASIAVDSIKGCMDEAGELVSAGIKEERMVEVGKMVGLREGHGGEAVRKWLEEGFVVYKSVGVGVMDIAIGRALMDLAGEKGVGVRLDSF